jgi:hypothetical protein
MGSRDYPKWNYTINLPDDMDARINRVEFVVRRRGRNRESRHRDTSGAFVRGTRATPALDGNPSILLAEHLTENQLPGNLVRGTTLASLQVSQADHVSGNPEHHEGSPPHAI